MFFTPRFQQDRRRTSISAVMGAPVLLQQGLFALVAAAVGVPPVLRKAWAGLKNRNLDMNCLVVVALAGSVGLGEWFEAGDKVPVDGTIESGTSVLDESMVTGESKPVTKSIGQAVLAGTVNSGSIALKVRATAAAGDSTVARLASLMEAAAASKSRHDMAVEAFAKYYTPLVVLVALLTVALGAALQPAAWRHWAYLSLVVLVTGCPCALVISTPVASVAGLTRAARRGVLIKGGRYLEMLGNLTAASFDKSGTLTEGHFQLTQLHTFGSTTQQQALQLAAALEQHSNHPIAHAVMSDLVLEDEWTWCWKMSDLVLCKPG
ncbi:hypothetical protein OEZ85_011687 [Tetradesmus obliquus]|uniref:P-type ATPase A domain-containing protein n=1 Tax=Tetradesmus obliquus TaxID=3088 RepID=A0ABY8TTE2_TETOB|nr:hypothetical protein OEZ85_011687 [Tetradesmus obliquus]